MGTGEGLTKCQRYYISLYSKLVNEGGMRRDKNLQNPVNVVYGCPLVMIFRETWVVNSSIYLDTGNELLELSNASILLHILLFKAKQVQHRLVFNVSVPT